MLLELDRGKLWAFMEPLLNSPAHSITAGDLMEFAQRNGVPRIIQCGPLAFWLPFCVILSKSQR